MHKVHIGTSGWAYSSWKPGFYPPKTPSSKFLEYYSSQLNCVEVNYTYRARPAVQTLQNWVPSTPGGCRAGCGFVFRVAAAFAACTQAGSSSLSVAAKLKSRRRASGEVPEGSS